MQVPCLFIGGGGRGGGEFPLNAWREKWGAPWTGRQPITRNIPIHARGQLRVFVREGRCPTCFLQKELPTPDLYGFFLGERSRVRASLDPSHGLVATEGWYTSDWLPPHHRTNEDKQALLFLESSMKLK